MRVHLADERQRQSETKTRAPAEPPSQKSRAIDCRAAPPSACEGLGDAEDTHGWTRRCPRNVPGAPARDACWRRSPSSSPLRSLSMPRDGCSEERMRELALSSLSLLAYCPTREGSSVVASPECSMAVMDVRDGGLRVQLASRTHLRDARVRSSISSKLRLDGEFGVTAHRSSSRLRHHSRCELLNRLRGARQLLRRRLDEDNGEGGLLTCLRLTSLLIHDHSASRAVASPPRSRRSRSRRRAPLRHGLKSAPNDSIHDSRPSTTRNARRDGVLGQR